MKLFVFLVFNYTKIKINWKDINYLGDQYSYIWEIHLFKMKAKFLFQLFYFQKKEFFIYTIHPKIQNIGWFRDSVIVYISIATSLSCLRFLNVVYVFFLFAENSFMDFAFYMENEKSWKNKQKKATVTLWPM